MIGVLIRRGKFGHRERHRGRILYDDEGRDWSSVAVSQGTPKIIDDIINRERHGIDSPLEPV